MVYIEKITLPSVDSDDTDYYGRNPKTTFLKSGYPFHVLSFRGLFEVEFSDITIITGGNGTGKSTLLNVIAQKLNLKRPTPFNNTELFEDYLMRCRFGNPG